MTEHVLGLLNRQPYRGAMNNQNRSSQPLLRAIPWVSAMLVSFVAIPAHAESLTDGPHLSLTVKVKVLDKDPQSGRKPKRRATVESRTSGITVPLHSAYDSVSGTFRGCFGEASVSIEVSEGKSLSYRVWVEDSEAGPVVHSRVGGFFKEDGAEMVSVSQDGRPELISEPSHRSRGGGFTDINQPTSLDFKYLLLVEMPESGICPRPRGSAPAVKTGSVPSPPLESGGP